jgi:hypothetical protein
MDLQLHAHCWHMIAPPTAPRSYGEFQCCHCGEKKFAENWTLQQAPHGAHKPPSEGDFGAGYSIW